MTQKVQCVSKGGYSFMKEGEIGELVEVCPSHYEDGFTWPEYWKVKLESGKHVTGHTHRFKKIM